MGESQSRSSSGRLGMRPEQIARFLQLLAFSPTTIWTYSICAFNAPHSFPFVTPIRRTQTTPAPRRDINLPSLWEKASPALPAGGWGMRPGQIAHFLKKLHGHCKARSNLTGASVYIVHTITLSSSFSTCENTVHNAFLRGD